MKDVQGGRQKFVDADLEQFVAGVGLQDIGQAQGVMAAGREAGRLHYPPQFAPQERRIARRFVIGLGGEQPYEAHLARRLAVGAETANSDVVHVHPPVDPRAQVGLGHHHRFGDFQTPSKGGRQHRRLACPAQDRARGITQHAQAAFGLVERLFGGVAAIGRARVLIDSGAQKHEMAGVHPAQELHLLGHGFGAARRGSDQFGDRAGHQRQHGGEIGHRGAHVRQGGQDVLDQAGAAFLTHRRQPHLDHRAARLALTDDGVEHGLDLGAALADFAHHAIDQERRVGLDDLQQIGLQVAPVGPLGADQPRRRRLAVGRGAEPPEV